MLPSRRGLVLGVLASLALATIAGAALADERLDLSTDWRDRLAALRVEPKFMPDEAYVGYLPEEHQPAAEALVNGLIDRLLEELATHRDRTWVRAQVKDTYDWFRLSDTEDRDRCAAHLADILGALGIAAANWEELDPWLDRFDRLAAFTHRQLEG